MSTRETPLSRPPNGGHPAAGRTPRSRRARRLGAALATSALIAGPLTALAISNASAAPRASAAAATNVLYDASSGLASGQIPYPHQSYIKPHVTVVADPMGGNFNVMKFAVADSDRPYAGASNARADFRTPSLMPVGSDTYSSIKFLIPAGFPAVKGGSGFFQIAEIYGPPYGGSPTIGIDLFPGAGGRPLISLQRDASHGYDRPWTGPTLDTGWHTLYIHDIESSSEAGGLVQLWFDGSPQTFTNGSTSIHYRTYGPSDGGGANFLNINQYRRAGAYPGTVVTYHAASKIGTTLAAVQDSGNPTTTTTTATTPTTTTTTTTTTTANPGPLSAQFTSPSTSVTGRPVTFDGSGSTGSPVSYVWKDGNITLGTSKSLTFTFHYVGIKHVVLTVTDASGKTASVQHNVSVS